MRSKVGGAGYALDYAVLIYLGMSARLQIQGRWSIASGELQGAARA